MSQKCDQLISLLRELFQLDQPDLDFGICRILRARSAEITQLLEKDRLPQVKAVLAQHQSADKAALEKDLAKVVEQARSLGADEPQRVKQRVASSHALLLPTPSPMD